MNFHVMMKDYKDSDKISKVQASDEVTDKHEFIKIVLEELDSNLKLLIKSMKKERKYISEEKIKTKSQSNDFFIASNKKDPDEISMTKKEARSKSFSKILTSLLILMNSLNFKEGEPIASNLFNLYDYCRREVINGHKNKKISGIKSASLVITDILSAWKQIK